MRIRASKADIIWSYVGTIFSLSSSFLLLPFVLHYLTSNQIGLWYIFLAINGLVSLFDFGFDPTFARNVAYAWSGAKNISKNGVTDFTQHASPNLYLLHLIVTASKYLYGFLSSFALVVVASVGTIYILHVGQTLPTISYLPAWVIFCLALFFNMYLGYYSALLRGLGAVSKINQATFWSKSVQLCVSAVGLVLGWGLLAVAIGFFLNGLVLRFICKHIFDNYHIQKKPAWNQEISFTAVKSVLKTVSYNASRDGVVAISNYLVTQSSSLLASMFLTLTQTGEYSISLQLATAISNISASMIYAYHPTFQSAFLTHDIGAQRRVVSRGLSVFYLLSIVGTILVIIVGFPVLRFFKPASHFDIPIFLGISIYMFFWQQQTAGASYISDTNHVPYVRAYIVSGILSVLLATFLLHSHVLGVWALIIGPGIVQLSYNNWKWLHLVLRRLKTSLVGVLITGLEEWLNFFLKLIRK